MTPHEPLPFLLRVKGKAHMIFYTEWQTPFCPVVIAGNDTGITHLHLKTGEGKRQFAISPSWMRDDRLFSSAIAQITAYMEGSRTSFDLPLSPRGTPFQKRVWEALCHIPYGTTTTYGEIAKKIGAPNAARAVGAANGKNPIPLLIPCHRVVGASGKLTGFAHGIAIKATLLNLESKNRRGSC